MLAGVVVGNQLSENWANGRRTADFFDVKGELEGLFRMLGVEIQFSPGQHPALHPGQYGRADERWRARGLAGNPAPASSEKA